MLTIFSCEFDVQNKANQYLFSNYRHLSQGDKIRNFEGDWGHPKSQIENTRKWIESVKNSEALLCTFSPYVLKAAINFCDENELKYTLEFMINNGEVIKNNANLMFKSFSDPLQEMVWGS